MLFFPRCMFFCYFSKVVVQLLDACSCLKLFPMMSLGLGVPLVWKKWPCFSWYPPQKVQYQISTHTYPHPEKLRNLKKKIWFVFISCLTWPLKTWCLLVTFVDFSLGMTSISPGASDGGSSKLQWACFMAARNA